MSVSYLNDFFRAPVKWIDFRGFSTLFYSNVLTALSKLVMFSEISRNGINRLALRMRAKLKKFIRVVRATKPIPSEAIGRSEPSNREDWKAIRAISDKTLKKLISQHLDHDQAQQIGRDVHVIRRTEGSFHHCAILTDRTHGDFVIRIPAIGTKSVWQERDAYNLRSEVGTMKYLYKTTAIPIPEIIAYDDTTNNTIGAPYILMRVAHGKPAAFAWFEQDEQGRPHIHGCDFASLAREKIRKNFLRSLASLMAILNTLRAERIGMLDFDHDQSDPEVGHSYYASLDGTLGQKPIFKSSREFWTQRLIGTWDFGENYLYRGMYLFLTVVANNMPTHLDEAGTESFALTHIDVDLQNLFTDEEGNITGIIDWDHAELLPHCIGPTSVPVFLREDWGPDYSLEDATHMPFALAHYRKLFSAYMNEAIRKEAGSRYTSKSMLYHAAAEALLHPEHYAREFLDRIFKESDMLRGFDSGEFLEELGKDGEEGRGANLVRGVVKRMFKP